MPKKPPPPPPRPSTSTGASSSASVADVSNNPINIEWSSEASAWEGSIEGVEGVVRGDSPCDAAVHLLDAIMFGFRTLEVYGVERLITGEALGAIEQLKRDVRRAHETAHEAEECLAEAERTNTLS